MTQTNRVLVTDFDGTITRHDFYKLAVERFLTAADLAPWEAYRAGAISHFTALQRIFANITAPVGEVQALLPQMEPEPQLAACAKALGAAGWRVVVASAGSLWYVTQILEAAGVPFVAPDGASAQPAAGTFELHSNYGSYGPNGPFVLTAPEHSPFYSAQTGIDKAGIVRSHLSQGAVVAYAGDGFTDVEAALLVPPSLRFARADLADSLRERDERYISFERWAEVAQALAPEA